LGEPATGPSQCLLLVAVPVDESSFRRAWARGSDYLTGAYADLATGLQAYGRTADVAAALCADCRQLGATVVVDATAADLAARAAQFSVVTVVAHVAFPPVMPDDVLDGAALMRLVSEGPEAEWQMVRAEVGVAAGLPEIIAALNRLLEATGRDLDAGVTQDVRDGQRRARQRPGRFGLLRFDRPRLDELCGATVLRPGAGIEMADGMITCERFVEAIPERYDGFMDLRMCNSISVGVAVRRARPARIAVGKRKTNVYAALVIYKTALVYMAQRARAGRPVSYEDAMFSLYEAIS
jgi:hypothetical protein